MITKNDRRGHPMPVFILERRDMQIAGQVFVVTGAASGLGAATARMLAENGGKVVLADLQEEAGEKLATELIGKDGPHTMALFQKTLNINLVGTFNMARLAADAMSKQDPLEQGERGVIINTASVAAFDGQIGQTAYSASKAAIVGMTLPMARDLARSGIRVMTIAPGIFETPMMMSMPQEVLDSLGGAVPFPPRLGKATEYAHLAKTIIENLMLNGETIRLDGAIRMPPK